MVLEKSFFVSYSSMLHHPEDCHESLRKLRADLFSELANHVENNGKFAINYSERQEVFRESEFKKIVLCVDIWRVPETTIRFISAESKYLQPKKNMRDKLKCCIRYLLDKTGGGICYDS